MNAASTAGVPAGPDQADFAGEMHCFSSCALPCASGGLACRPVAYCQDIQKLLQELRFATEAYCQPRTSSLFVSCRKIRSVLMQAQMGPPSVILEAELACLACCGLCGPAVYAIGSCQRSLARLLDPLWPSLCAPFARPGLDYDLACCLTVVDKATTAHTAGQQSWQGLLGLARVDTGV